MLTVSATGSAGRSIPGCPGTVWVTGAAGGTRRSGPWAGAGWSQAAGTSGQRAAGPPAGQRTGIAGPWGRCPPADPDPAAHTRPRRASASPRSSGMVSRPQLREEVSQLHAPWWVPGTGKFSLFGTQVPRPSRRFKSRSQADLALPRVICPPTPRAGGGGQCLQRQGSSRQARLVGKSGASGYGEAHSLQALKGCGELAP